MTSVGGSVGGENWCVYADLDAYCDTAAIMSYGMSWAGSAPVSYTHLDVYKRQRLHRSLQRWNGQK